MHSGDNSNKKPGEYEPKSEAEVTAALKQASRVIPVNQKKRMQEAMVDVVNLILSLRVNDALSGESVFAGATHPNVPKKPPKNITDENDYVKYLYSDAFVPAQALSPTNIGRIVGWLKESLDENDLMVSKWISLLQDINNVTSKEDVDQVRTAIIFYCCSRVVEGDYLRQDAALNKELADGFIDFAESPQLSKKINKVLDELQQSAMVIKNGAFADKDNIISIVIAKFQQHETERQLGNPKPSFGLPTPVIRLLVHQINHQINELTGLNEKPGLLSGLFNRQANSGTRKLQLIDNIYLLSCLLESKDIHALIDTYQNNLESYRKLEAKSKAVVDTVITYVATGIKQEGQSKTPSPRGNSSD